MRIPGSHDDPSDGKPRHMVHLQSQCGLGSIVRE
jgi:hypothetical protein